MRVLLVLAVIGQLLRWFCLTFIPPILMAAWDRDWFTALSFLVAGVGGLLLGTGLSVRYQSPRVFHRSEAMAVVAGTWMVVAIFAGIPFVFHGLGPIEALFEAMSGLTTTGATVFTDFSKYNRSIFLWRGITHWIGGLGVIALFVIVLPRLGIAGRQLFFAESSSAPGEDVSPQIRSTASRLWALYVAMTLLCTVALVACGMPLFDSVVHAFATLAAGGFSPNGESILGYHNPAAEWVLVVFMWLAGASFPLQYKVFTGQDPRGFFKDDEFIFYTAVFVLSSLSIALVLGGGLPDLEGLRAGFFQVASVISSTGFASVNFDLWSDSAKMVLLVPMIVGACAGSAGGGPKAVRHLLVGRQILREIRQVLHPRAVLPLRYKGQGVPPGVMRAVFALTALFVGCTFVFGVVLVFLGEDLVTAFTASLACMGNIGPGYNEVGPMGNYAGIHWFGQLVLIVAMWIGRLEIFTVVALLHPDVIKSLRFSRT